jgi:plastocyanin
MAADLDLGVLDRDGRSLGEVVVLIDSTTTNSQKSLPASTAIVDQLHQQFVPGVIAVRTGTAISFPNSDTVSHQVYSFSPAKRFELGLYRGVPRDPVVFDKPGIVTLGCNIHDNMIGYVYVTDAAYFGTTGDDGHFHTAIPPGKYRLQFWSPLFSKEDNARVRDLDVTGETPMSLNVRIASPIRAPGTEQHVRRLRDY